MEEYVVKKGKKFFPSKELKEIAWVASERIYKDAARDPFAFWCRFAEELAWFKKWRKIYQEKLPYFKWFIGGELNACFNCIDRYLTTQPNKVAIYWEPENLEERERKLTYAELFREVNEFAQVLKLLGIRRGDRVVIYMPMIPEVIVAMLACARIGAIHCVVFSAFSSEALRTRILDADAKLLITCDHYYRRGKVIDLLSNAREGIKGTKVKKVLVVPRKGKIQEELKRNEIAFNELSKEVKGKYCEPARMQSEDLLFILHESGSAGKPEIAMHSTGGYLVQAYATAKLVFDLHDFDVFFSTADIGWITGHTYSCYGPLANGASFVIYEGAPDYPNCERIWQIIEKYNVTIFYTAPTLIRMLMRYGEEHVKKYELETLRILASVGEPIDEKTWKWYFRLVGKSRCPIIDTWWQTETGGTLINTLPGVGPFVPTVAGLPFPGTRWGVLRADGKHAKPGEDGELVALSPFAPGMLRGLWRDEAGYVKTYWSRFPNAYLTNDRAVRLSGNLIKILGRSDDVMKVAGHRLSTAELENAIASHPAVAECCVVGMRHEIKGEVPVAFVVLKHGAKATSSELIKLVEKKISKIAKPAAIYFVNSLPHTRSGKIMRRLIRRVLHNEELGDTSTLLNPESLEEIRRVIKRVS